MPELHAPILLKNRAVLTLSGPDRKSFLQGLITNNVEKISENTALYAALLSPQGKYLHDFFISELDNILYLDCERDRLPDLFRRLMMYKLRAEVDIVDCSDKYCVLAASSVPPNEKFFSPDPRHPKMGVRMIRPRTDQESSDHTSDQYENLRLGLGIPDGSRDFDVDRTLILEGNMEELNGVDFNKGCYVGQEVTARMKHRASLKKRLLPVKVEGTLPDRGTEITNGAEKKIGDLRSGLETDQGNRAIGYFRLADMEFDQTYVCGGALVTPWCPDWYNKTERS